MTLRRACARRSELMSLSQMFGIERAMIAAHRVVYAVLRFLGLLFGLIPKSGKFSRNTYRAIHYAFVIAVTCVLAWYSSYLIPRGQGSHIKLVRAEVLCRDSIRVVLSFRPAADFRNSIVPGRGSD